MILGEILSDRRPIRKHYGSAQALAIIFWYFHVFLANSSLRPNLSDFTQTKKLLYWSEIVFLEGMRAISEISKAGSCLQAFQA